VKRGQILPRNKQSIIRLGLFLKSFHQHHIIFATPFIYGNGIVPIEDESSDARPALEVDVGVDGSGARRIQHGGAEGLGGGDEEGY